MRPEAGLSSGREHVGNSSVVDFVSHHRNLGYGERRFGFNFKYQSTTSEVCREDWAEREASALLCFPGDIEAVVICVYLV